MENKILDNCNLKYIAAILNSDLMNFYYQVISLEKGRPMAQIDIDVIEKLPIPNPKINLSIITQIEKLVDNILQKKPLPKGEKNWEKQIDDLVYVLYGITDQKDIDIIEQAYP